LVTNRKQEAPQEAPSAERRRIAVVPGPQSPAVMPAVQGDHALETVGLSVFYGKQAAVKSVSIGMRRKAVTAIIGPSGCGKSTLLRCFNRMNDFIPAARIEGQVLFQGQDIYARDVDPTEIRFRIGMVFQKANPFPKSIYENVAYGPKINGFRENMGEIVEKSLRRAALWDEVKDRLTSSAFALSGGQQQRLCIARALAVDPELLLMDEPASALDPIATSRIEDLIQELANEITIVIVTHNMQQAARASSMTAFMLAGDLVEYSPTKDLFTNPKDERTEAYITGRFG